MDKPVYSDQDEKTNQDSGKLKANPLSGSKSLQLGHIAINPGLGPGVNMATDFSGIALLQ